MKITKAMIQRVSTARGLLDPCVICGGVLFSERWVGTGKFDGRNREIQKLEPYPGHSREESCGHTLEETAAVIQHIKSMSPAAVAEVMAGD